MDVLYPGNHPDLHFQLHSHVRRADCVPQIQRQAGSLGEPMGRAALFPALHRVAVFREDSDEHIDPEHLRPDRILPYPDSTGADAQRVPA